MERPSARPSGMPLPPALASRGPSSKPCTFRCASSLRQCKKPTWKWSATDHHPTRQWPTLPCDIDASGRSRPTFPEPPRPDAPGPAWPANSGISRGAPPCSHLTRSSTTSSSTKLSRCYLPLSCPSSSGAVQETAGKGFTPSRWDTAPPPLSERVCDPMAQRM